MRIVGGFRVRVVHAMFRRPGDRASLESERAAYGQKVLDGFRSFERAVAEKAMVTYADAEAAPDPGKQIADAESRPAEIEKGGHRPDVHRNDEKGHRPIDRVIAMSGQYFFLHFFS